MPNLVPGCLAEAQELAWGGCKLGFLQICRPECPKASQLPPGVHAVQCHPSAMTAGLRYRDQAMISCCTMLLLARQLSIPLREFDPTRCRSLLLRMELPASQVAACGTPALHRAASRLGMQTFDTTSLVKVGRTVHQRCFFSSFTPSCENFIIVRVVHLQHPGHQLHLLVELGALAGCLDCCWQPQKPRMPCSWGGNGYSPMEGLPPARLLSLCAMLQCCVCQNSASFHHFSILRI